MVRLFEYFKELFFALFFSFFILSIVAGIIQRVRGKAEDENPLTPMLFVLGLGCMLLFFIWMALWLIGLAPAINLRQYWWA